MNKQLCVLLLNLNTYFIAIFIHRKYKTFLVEITNLRIKLYGIEACCVKVQDKIQNIKRIWKKVKKY